MSKSVLVIGPGFIGWNVLDLLVAEGNYTITGFVRRKEHGEQLKASGGNAVQIVQGDLNDKEKITQETLKHEIVFHTATADHLPSVKAVIDGIKQRAANGQSTIFIHTSGTSVLDDWAEYKGNSKSDKVYHDNRREEIDSVPDSAPHRKIDLAIVEAQRQLGEKAKLAIMIPPLIYGFNKNHGRLTIQMPTLTRFALKHGYAGHIAKGLAVESDIHVLDLARAYVVLLHHMEKASPREVLENPYYFCEGAGEHEASWRERAAAIGEGLHKAGKLKDPTPKEIPQKDWDDLFGVDINGPVIGLNSRSRAVRLRELGWKPVEKDWRSSYLEDELPEILEENVDRSKFTGYGGVAAA